MGSNCVTPCSRYTLFPLHPDTPDDGQTLEQLFAGRSFDIEAAQARLVGLMAEEGLPYGRRTRTYNSRLAQELAKWAETEHSGRPDRAAGMVRLFIVVLPETA